jgi:hypothetical protein
VILCSIVAGAGRDCAPAAPVRRRRAAPQLQQNQLCNSGAFGVCDNSGITMARDACMNAVELARAINESGFPLQVGLKLLANTGDWRVALSEPAWRDPNSEDPKFIDIVLRGRGPGPLRLVIECKRARDTEWIFLREPTSYADCNNRLNVRARLAVRRQSGPGVVDWTDIPFIPGSAEANYCVIRKNRQRSQDLLEKTAAELVRATEALARQEYTINDRVRQGDTTVNKGLSRVYVPMIVTTAKMYICDADYQGVDLQTGEVPNSSATAFPVVRFRKSLGGGDHKEWAARSVEQFAEWSERSVVVVQAAAFLDLLRRWDLGQLPHYLVDDVFPDGS